MSLVIVADGELSDASQLNQVILILQAAAGAQEVRNYFLLGSSYVNAATISLSQNFLSSVSTPVSVSVNTAIQGPSNVGAPVTAHITATGCQIWCSSTAVNPNVGAAGAYTVQF